MWCDVGLMIRFNFMRIRNLHLDDYHVGTVKTAGENIKALLLWMGEVTV